MDEYSRGMDPQVKRYFRRIMNSFSYSLIWLLSVSTAGLFFRLAIVRNGIRWYNVVYYVLALATLIWLLLFLYKTWKDKMDRE